jgi:hypothetical protein
MRIRTVTGLTVTGVVAMAAMAAGGAALATSAAPQPVADRGTVLKIFTTSEAPAARLCPDDAV